MSKKFYGGIAIQNAQELGFFDSDSSNFNAFKSPSALTGDTTWELPDGDSTGSQALTSNGSATLTWASYISATLTDANILVGNGSNVATDVALSGDATIANTGALTIAAGAIDNAKINASAAVEFSKMENLTNARALVSDGSGDVSVSAVTSTELGYVGGVTSAIQTQINTLTSTINNFEWQESALDYVVDNTAVPATEVTGNRYVLSDDGGAPHANWDGASAGDIVEFNGTTWDAVTPTTGTFVAVDDDTSGLYLWGGSSYSFKSFEATTASTGLTKVGFDVRLDATAGGDGLGFTTGVLNVNVDDSTIETNTDALRLKDGGITNAKVNASAAIDFSKMANLTVSRALVSDGSGDVSVSLVTATELGYLDGVTSALQTQLDAKAGTALDNLSIASLAAEDILVASSGTAVGRLAAGSEGQVLKIVSGSVAWAADAGSTSHSEDWDTADTATFAITHSLGTKDILVQINDKTDDSTIEVDSVIRTSTSIVTCSASAAPPVGGWRVVIIAA